MKKIQAEAMFLSLGVQLNQELLKAAKSLLVNRNNLLLGKGDLGGRRLDAIQHINSAVQDIRAYCR